MAQLLHTSELSVMQLTHNKTMQTITLTYKRLPDRVNYFEQQLLYKDQEVIVTTQRVTPSTPIVIDGETVLGDDFYAIWFVFTGFWYDIGKIYNLDNEWTGYYCDIILPMKCTSDKFEIVDLILDLWVSPNGTYEIQDEDEFATALENGIIEPELANKAQIALNNLIDEVKTGSFPPEFVKNFKTQL